MWPAIAALYALSCSSMEDQARNEFLAEYPDRKLIRVDAGDGDSSTVYLHFKYVVRGEQQVREEVWQYMKNDTGWLRTHPPR
jgi:hypothetical protein